MTYSKLTDKISVKYKTKCKKCAPETSNIRKKVSWGNFRGNGQMTLSHAAGFKKVSRIRSSSKQDGFASRDCRHKNLFL